MILLEWLHDLGALLTKQHLFNLLSALLILLIGIFIARRARSTFQKLSQLDPQQRMLLSKFSYYGLIAAAIATSLGQMGFDIRVLVGAAGVLTVAIGFASQTSASNLISGLFLMIDRPFVLGDFIAIGDQRGEVVSIDLLSSKIRTLNNTLVRIPNETMIKSSITNLSYYPLRRVELNFNLRLQANTEKAEDLLKQVAARHPLCLAEPPPVFLFNGFADNAIQVQMQIWTLRENMTKLQNELYHAFTAALDQEDLRQYPR